MTDDELIELIEQVKRDGYGTVSLVLNALATRSGVKPEPPARDAEPCVSCGKPSTATTLDEQPICDECGHGLEGSWIGPNGTTVPRPKCANGSEGRGKEPPAPARDEFDEMAEKMIEFEQRGHNAYWMKICGILIGDCQLVGRCMSDKDRLKPALASALRDEAEKGKAERETMERVKVLAKSYRDGANAHVVAGAIDAIVNSEDRT